jgi:DNA-binding transcriptional MerR regulator
MTRDNSKRLLTIGEFSAATQLSAKALRLYDDANLLQPASVDAETGYRYYQTRQIPRGRLIRILREMDLSLPTIADIISAPPSQAHFLLHHQANAMDREYAQRKRAFQLGLALMQQGVQRDETPCLSRSRGSSQITAYECPAETVFVSGFIASGTNFFQRLPQALQRICGDAEKANLTITGDGFCLLAEPLGEDESRLEIALPVNSGENIPVGATLRQLAVCPSVMQERRGEQFLLQDLEAMLDGLFDWLDRNTCRAVGDARLSLLTDNETSQLKIIWPFEFQADTTSREQS